MEKEELVKLLKLLELDKTFVRMLKDECGYYLVYEYSDEEVPFKRCIANYCQNDKNLEKIFILDKFVCNGKKGKKYYNKYFFTAVSQEQLHNEHRKIFLKKL